MYKVGNKNVKNEIVANCNFITFLFCDCPRATALDKRKNIDGVQLLIQLNHLKCLKMMKSLRVYSLSE